MHVPLMLVVRWLAVHHWPAQESDIDGFYGDAATQGWQTKIFPANSNTVSTLLDMVYCLHVGFLYFHSVTLSLAAKIPRWQTVLSHIVYHVGISTYIPRKRFVISVQPHPHSFLTSIRSNAIVVSINWQYMFTVSYPKLRTFRTSCKPGGRTLKTRWLLIFSPVENAADY